MGYSISWLAIRNKSIDAILGELDLIRTGRFEEVPESPFSAIFPNEEWSVIFANDFRFIDRAPLAALSQSSDLITCGVEEHIGASSASGLKNGAPSWSIVHDGQKGLSHLEQTGEVPRELEAIKARLTADLAQAGGEKSDADYLFDVPIDLANALTGFRHDRYQGDEPKFEILERAVKVWKFSSETINDIPLPPTSTFAIAFRELDSKTNSFFILEHQNGSYIQCGGGKGACTVELRIGESAASRKHYVVGRGDRAGEPAKVQMSHGVVSVHENEILSDREAVELFESFFLGEAIPKWYRLREKDI